MKYSYVYSKIVSDVTIDEIWAVWEDVNSWNKWQSDLDYAKLSGDFVTGETFVFKPKGGPKFKLSLVEVKPKSKFIDCARFPLAKMFATHEFIRKDDTVEIRATFRFTGVLAGLWWNIIGKKIAHNEAKQTEELLSRIRLLKDN
jgi:hypothetical protein